MPDPNQNPLGFARSMMGAGEIPHRTALRDYLYNGGVNLDPAMTAWCAAYVNASLQQAGIAGTGSPAARSFLNWGQRVDKPQEGDLAVFSRTSDPAKGHVGFFTGYDERGNIKVLGGNQSDAVSVEAFPATRLLGFRRADPNAAPYNPQNPPRPINYTPGALQQANASPGAGTPGASQAPVDLPSIAGMTSPFDTAASDDSLGGTLGKAAATDDSLTEAPRTVDPAAYLTDPRIPKLAEALTAANAQQAPATPVLDETAPLFNIKNIGQAKQFKPRRIT